MACTQGLTEVETCTRYAVGQINQLSARKLTPGEQEKLNEDKNVLSPYKQEKLELDAKKNWDLFYKRNTTKFFKDRHWTHREFEELSQDNLSKREHTILEVGCGCGNTIFPIIEDNEKVFIYACDFSPRAVDFVKLNPLYNSTRCLAFQCDLTKDNLTQNIKENSVDIITMLFVLSAVLPNNMDKVLCNIRKVLKPGGLVLFRDYGLYDHAMLRFRPGHKLDDNFYVRQDGTRAYYFSLDFVSNLFSTAGYAILENQYIEKRTINKKEGIDVPRIFVQGKYQKPL